MTGRAAIAVEGPRDVVAVKRAGDFRCVVTHGFSLSMDTRRQLLRAVQTRGLIVLTDPDAAGATIRRGIVAVVGPCEHAWLRVPEATRGGNIGVENASPEAIRAALAAARLWRRDPPRRWTAGRLRRLGLAEADRIHAVCETLRIGHGDLRGLAGRLNALGVDEAELLAALARS